MERSSYQKLTQTAVVVNLTLNFDNPGIQIQVKNQVSKSKADSNEEATGSQPRLRNVRTKRWTQLSTRCLSEVEQYLKR